MESFHDTVRNLTTQYDSSIERLVIGLDFGTTYSGVAYAFAMKPYTITEWPGARGRNLLKVPTILKYEKDNLLWGYELDRTTKGRIEGIKLLLDADQPKPLYVPAINTQVEIKKLGKAPIDVAIDYISAIYQHSLKKIEGKYPEGFLELVDKQFVLSVPAVWSDKAKDATLRAARNASISPITLIKKPEAAALFTLHFLKDKGLDVGHALVLCDAGGGTVDLTSYEITHLKPLMLKELVPCSGGLAGSLMLNLRFEQSVKDVVGEKAFLDLKQTDSFRLAMKQFDESIKPEFKSKEDENRYVNFPMGNLQDNPAKGLKANCITMTGAALHDIFEPLFRDINNLVGEQVNKVYVKRLKDQHPKGNDIKVRLMAQVILTMLVSMDRRGTVLSQLPQEALVVCSVAPKHYGVSGGQIYDPVRDQGESKCLDEKENVWRCTVMSWYINKGDDCVRSRKIALPFYTTFDPNPSHDDLQISSDLLECEMEKEPTHPKAGTVTRNCILKSDLSAVPKHLFKKRKQASNGEEYWELSYNLLVSIKSGPMVFSLQVGGKEYGQVGADY